MPKKEFSELSFRDLRVLDALFREGSALPRIEIAQYWHERYHRDPAHRWLRSVSFELFGDRA